MSSRVPFPTSAAGSAPKLRVRGLSELLRGLSEPERALLAEKTHVRLDEGKRIGSDQQLARALVTRPEQKSLRGLSAAERAVVFTLAQEQVESRTEPASLPTPLLDAARALCDRAWVFRAPERGVEANQFVLPTAHLLQLPSWEGEDPLSLRRLLSLQGPDVASGIVRYFGGPAVAPWTLGLELVYEILSEPVRLQAEVRGLGDSEGRLLREICRLGGEIESIELLDLEREPLRLSGAWGVSASRRGVSFELERRAFLLPIGSNRYAVAAEVHALVVATERGRASAEQQRLRTRIEASTIEPLRAQFSRDPVPYVLGMALHAQRREGLRANVGTPRSLWSSIGQGLGLEPAVAELFAVLGRGLGLWTSPEPWRELGTVSQLFPRLIESWRLGVVWDLGRAEPEVLRAPASARAPSPARDVALALLDALKNIGAQRWVALEALGQLTLSDPRLVNIDARLQRWAKRLGLAVPEASVVIARATQDLFALGVLDRADRADAGLGTSSAVHVAARTRSLWSQVVPASEAALAVQPLGPLRFELGPQTQIAATLAAGPLLEPSGFDPRLTFEVSPQGVERFALAGGTAAQMRALLEPLGTWTDASQALVEEATRSRVRLDLAPAAGFVWIEDEALRERLRTQSGLAVLFVEPSPPGGLLVRAGVSLERLLKACRARGVALRLLDDAGSGRWLAESKKAVRRGRKPRA